MLDEKTVYHEETCTTNHYGIDDKFKPGHDANPCPRSWVTQTYNWQDSDCDQKRVGPPRKNTSKN